MKFKCYNKIWTSDGKGMIPKTVFTSVMKKNWGKHFKSKEDLIVWWLSRNGFKYFDVEWLSGHILNFGFEVNVVSFGSGTGVFEYLLKKNVGSSLNIVGLEYDPFLINRSLNFFPEILVKEFDYNKDSFLELNIPCDIAFFCDSFGHITDEGFLSIVSELRDAGVSELIILGGHRSNVLWYILEYLYGVLFNNHKNKCFFRYSRSRNEFLKLYKKAGLKSRMVLSYDLFYRGIRQIDVMEL